MLTFFQIRRTFYNLTVSITVDVDAGEADLIIKRDRIIIAFEQRSLRMHPTWRTPEGCNAWLAEQVPVSADGTMSRLEAWHRNPPFRTQREPEAA